MGDVSPEDRPVNTIPQNPAQRFGNLVEYTWAAPECQPYSEVEFGIPPNDATAKYE